MPKKTFTISNFTGGMVTDKNPREIEDNEWALLAGFKGTPEGILKMSGGFAYASNGELGCYLGWAGSHSSYQNFGVGDLTLTDVPEQGTWDGGFQGDGYNLTWGPSKNLSGGYGLHSFSSDWNHNEGDSYSTPTEMLLLFSRGSGDRSGGTLTEVFGNSDDGSFGLTNFGHGDSGHFTAEDSVYESFKRIQSAELTLGYENFDDSGGNVWQNFYSPDGNVRVSNGNLDSKYIRSEPKLFKYERRRWIGAITPEPIWGDGAGRYQIGGKWMVYNAGVEQGPYKRNLKMANPIHSNNHSAHLFNGYEGNAAAAVARPQPHTHSDTWGIGLGFYEEPGPDANTNGEGQGEWQPTAETRYKFWCTYLYDDEKQESAPTEFCLYPTFSGDWPEGPLADDPSPDSVPHPDGWQGGSVNSTTAPPLHPTTYGIRGSREGWGVPEMYFQKVKGPKGYGTATIDGSAEPKTDDIQLNTRVHFSPWVSLGQNNEFMMGGKSHPHSYWDSYHNGDWFHNGVGSGERDGPHTGNQRIVGARIYWSSNEDNHTNLWLMFDMDWEKGCKAYGADNPSQIGDFISDMGQLYGTPTAAQAAAGSQGALRGVGRTPTSEGEWSVWRRAQYSSSQIIRPNFAVNALTKDTNIGPYWFGPPKIITYQELNGFHPSTPTAARWKASVVINDVCYIGNYERPLFSFWETGSKHELMMDYHMGNLPNHQAGDFFDNDMGGEDDSTWSETCSYNLLKGGTFYWPKEDMTYPYIDWNKVDNDDDGSYEGIGYFLTWQDATKKRKIFRDRICKSPPGKHDTFPADNNHEIFIAGEDDGDEIIHLDKVGSDLLVFKKKALTILETGIITEDGTTEKVKSTHIGKGLDGAAQCQVCRTGKGVAWINSTGVYHYNGEEVISLSENKVDDWMQNKKSAYYGCYAPQVFSDTSWEEDVGGGYSQDDGGDGITEYFFMRKWAFPEDKVEPDHSRYGTTGDLPQFTNGNVVKSIGWDPKSNKLIVCKNVGKYPFGGSDNPSNMRDILVYDFETEGWNLVIDGHPEMLSNFVNFKGNLLAHARYLGDSYHVEDDRTGALSTSSEGYNRAWRYFTWEDDPVKNRNRPPNYGNANFMWHNGEEPGTDGAVIANDLYDQYQVGGRQTGGSDRILAITKDFTLGDPSRRKKVYKIYITWRGSKVDNEPWAKIKLYFSKNGEQTWPWYGPTNHVNDDYGFYTVNAKTSSTEGKGFVPPHVSDGSAGAPWFTSEFKPRYSSVLNNIYSIQLIIAQDSTQFDFEYRGDGKMHTYMTKGDMGFEIADITIVYREKGIK